MLQTWTDRMLRHAFEMNVKYDLKKHDFTNKQQQKGLFSPSASCDLPPRSRHAGPLSSPSAIKRSPRPSLSSAALSLFICRQKPRLLETLFLFHLYLLLTPSFSFISCCLPLSTGLTGRLRAQVDKG